MAKYICTLCGYIYDADDITQLPEDTKLAEENNCAHNWTLYRGIQDEPEDIGGELSPIEVEVVKTTEKMGKQFGIDYNLIKHEAQNEFKVGVDYFNELSNDYEKIYNDIKMKTGLNLSMPEFREMMESITLYNKESNDFMKLLNSKIIEKYTQMTIGTTTIALNKIITKLANNLIDRVGNGGLDDELSMENDKIAMVGSKALREYMDLLKGMQEYVIPETDKRLDSFKEDKDKKENEFSMSRDEIQLLLERLKEEESKEKEPNQS